MHLILNSWTCLLFAAGWGLRLGLVWGLAEEQAWVSYLIIGNKIVIHNVFCKVQLAIEDIRVIVRVPLEEDAQSSSKKRLHVYVLMHGERCAIYTLNALVTTIDLQHSTAQRLRLSRGCFTASVPVTGAPATTFTVTLSCQSDQYRQWCYTVT